LNHSYSLFTAVELKQFTFPAYQM